MSPSEIPIIRFRFFIPIVSHAVFFVAIAFSWFDDSTVIPTYLLVSIGLVMGFNFREAFLLKSFLKRRYPAECEKLARQAGYGPNFAMGARSSAPFWGLGFALLILGEGNAEGDVILKRLRRHQRWIWLEVFSTLPLTFVVIVLAGIVSKHYGG